MVSISGIDKGKVVAALYNAARPQGLGYLAAIGKPDNMTPEAGKAVYRQEDGWLDYVGGRSIKADVRGDEFDPALFDRDNGTGAAERAIAAIRA